MEKLFISYYRVSTEKQNLSHLGLEAQKEIVMKYISHNGNVLIKEFTEIESGKNSTNRPELQKALKLAKEKDACLVIAKLDRLSRSVSFISSLMESKINFIACDIPEATPLTLHIYIAMAEFERKRISERITEALQAKKRREPSWKPGTNNFTDAGSAKGRATIQSNIINDQAVRHAFHYIKPLRDAGYTYQAIAKALNDEGYKTRLGCSFHPSQVRSIMERFTVK